MTTDSGRVSGWHPIALVISLVAVAVVAGLGGLASASAADDYNKLNQPSWAPPSSVFGPTWGVLYILMAIAAWLVWRQQPTFRSPAIMLYIAQLVLNLVWSPLFFGAELRGLALIDIVILDVLVIATIAAFWQRSRTASLLLVPYLAWILFATALNYSVWSLNT